MLEPLPHLLPAGTVCRELSLHQTFPAGSEDPQGAAAPPRGGAGFAWRSRLLEGVWIKLQCTVRFQQMQIKVEISLKLNNKISPN